jgi:hypothetical protein
MIELPRACLVANRIAAHADFFSFGTNDLTQTALGFSRDDVESKFVPTYVERKIIDRSPFETIDEPGVGWLVRLAAWVGREAHPTLKLGICGEHGGDPKSIAFFDAAGLDLRLVLATPDRDRTDRRRPSGDRRRPPEVIRARPLPGMGRACRRSVAQLRHGGGERFQGDRRVRTFGPQPQARAPPGSKRQDRQQALGVGFALADGYPHLG